MKVITISREFGSGGRELGKRLAELLGYDYYDSEIIAMLAQKSGIDADYIDTLNNHAWKNLNLTFRGTLRSPTYLQSAKISLLLEQKKVIEGIAALGRDCIIVGRNADIILKDDAPLNLFVCASTEAKQRRCAERAPADEQLSEKELLHKMKQIDKARAQTRELISGAPWGKRDAYHLTVNTTEWEMKELVPAIADFAERWFGRKK